MRSRSLRPPLPSRPSRGFVRWGTFAAEEASAAGKTPSTLARAAPTRPRLLRLPIGTR